MRVPNEHTKAQIGVVEQSLIRPSRQGNPRQNETERMSKVDLIHARIVNDTQRHLRGAAKKGGIVVRRNARLKRIDKEVDEAWQKRKKAS